MVKHITTNRRQEPTNCFSVFDRFVRSVPKGLSSANFLTRYEQLSY